MKEPEAFVVTLEVDSDRALLLRLVSVLHRRAVEVVACELGPADGGQQTFCVTFLSDAGHATTVLRTLENVIGVTAAELVSTS